jgi:lipopolysaccharide/colanic/teichoic acid biosynthesis glycosyltransferase
MTLSAAGEATVGSPESEQVAALAAADLRAADLGLPPAAEPSGARSSAVELLGAAAIRMFDIVVAALLLLVLLPLVVVVAIAVRIESPGPAFFRCERVGYGGRPLRMLKLRKMSDRALGVALTTGQDVRLTRLGRRLAQLKIDEIPQLLHVLRGTMSLVGPRPEVAEFVGLHRDSYEEILSVRPGITGLSQIAFAEECRILDPDDPVSHYVNRILPQKVGLDELYVRRRSVALNLRILYWTAVAVVMRRPVAVPRDTGRMNLRQR